MTERRWCWTAPLYLVLLMTVVVALRTMLRPHPVAEVENKLLKMDQSKLILTSAPCNSSSPPVWLAIVSSAPNNSFHRHEIRRTWGQGRTVVFLLGAADPQLQPLIEMESRQYGDIVQGSFVDSYRNLTYKHVMGLQWASKHCPGAKYFLKTDDDVFVNTGYFENYLPGLPERRLILCPLMERAMVKRSYRSKWRVTHDEYSERWYPPYCMGWVILYSPDAALALSNEALKEPYFWIDDVHITGTIAKKLNLTHTPLGDLGIGEDITEEMISGNTRTDFMFSLTKPKYFQTLWNMVNDITSSTNKNV